ncbi:MAG TPA: OmpA family protein, partial [Polyangiaceae bacterium]|nr:OmpA family protein [Polyangiaceae bacterium]
PEPKEFTVKVVDETGKGVAGIPMVFSGAGTSETVPTDASGVAKWKAAAESVEVTFESAESVNQAMKSVWQSRAATPLDAYLAEGSDVVAVTSRPAAVEALGGDFFSSLSVAAAQPKTLSIRPAKKRAVLIEMHDTLFRTGSAVVNPEGEAPSTAVGEHESITTVGLVATILRYNEEHEGKKLFIAGHADRAGDDAGNVKLSEHRAKAVLALVEGKKDDYIAACGAKHSEVDVTQLFDWVNRQFGFTCKPTVMDRPPSDENYVKFRKSFNLWVKNGPAEGEKEPRGTEIGQYGRLQPDLWGAMFDLYEYNLRDELGENSDGVATLRQGLTWVDGDKKTVGFGEKHPTTENAVDGMRSRADRRVEVLLFDGGEEPDLAGKNGEDIYDGVTFERRRVEAMKSARKVDCFIRCFGYDDEPVPEGTVYDVRVGRVVHQIVAGKGGVAPIRLGPSISECDLVEWEAPAVGANGPLRVKRAGVKLVELSDEDTERRLLNLGYTQEQLDDRVAAFQRDWGQKETGTPGDILPHVKRWHDEGQRPDYLLASDATPVMASLASGRGGSATGAVAAGQMIPGVRKGASPSPKILVKRYVDESGMMAPAKVTKKSDRDMWYLEILRGQHTAITLEGASGVEIRSNNPENAVPMDANLWIDTSPNADPRNIFFYGRRMPLQRTHADGSLLSVAERNAILAADQTSMFEILQGAPNQKPTRTLLQVRVVQYPKPYYAFMKLFGKRMALAAADVYQYQLNPTGAALDYQCTASRDPRNRQPHGTDLQDNLINRVMHYAPDHLVIAAHGSVMPHAAHREDWRWKETEVMIGRDRGLNRTQQSLALWDRLHGRVKYIWFMNCNVGADLYMFAEIARRTGAWVSAASESTEKPRNVPYGCIEYVEGSWRHWNGQRFTQPLVEGVDWPEPDTEESFFQSARYRQESSLEPSLYFNLDRIGGRYVNEH